MAIGEIKTLVFSDGVAVSAPTLSTRGPIVTDTTGWTGSQTSISYTVTGLVSDARLVSWTLKNASYEQVLAKISSADANTVTVQADEPLPVGTYYLFGTAL